MYSLRNTIDEVARGPPSPPETVVAAALPRAMPPTFYEMADIDIPAKYVPWLFKRS